MAASHLRLCIGLPVGGIEYPSTAHALHVALPETEKEKEKEKKREQPKIPNWKNKSKGKKKGCITLVDTR